MSRRNNGYAGPIEDEYHSSSRHNCLWMLFVSVLALISIPAIVMSAVSLTKTDVGIDQKTSTFTATFSGLGDTLANATVTTYHQGGEMRLRITPVNNTCTANASTATYDAGTDLVGKLPTSTQTGPVVIYSAGVLNAGYITITATGVITVSGYSTHFQSGNCGWTSDLIFDYIAK